MGPVIILLVYYTQVGELSATVFWIALPIGLLIAGILMANNIRDREADVKGGRKTLAILLGRRRTTLLLGGLFLLSYLVNLALVLWGHLSPWTLLVLLSIPSAHKVIRLFLTETDPTKLHPAVKGTSQLLAKFGVLMSTGMLVSVLL
jgi:1,4-dihydroxy-2-naphthoate octaprenyltransferase